MATTGLTGSTVAFSSASDHGTAGAIGMAGDMADMAIVVDMAGAESMPAGRDTVVIAVESQAVQLGAMRLREAAVLLPVAGLAVAADSMVEAAGDSTAVVAEAMAVEDTGKRSC